MTALKTYALSVTGRRKNNQDACIAWSPGNGVTLLAVADGMGGYEGGEIASRLVIDSLKSALLDEVKQSSTLNLKTTIKRFFNEADLAIRKHLNSNPQRTGMGTTLCCMLIQNDHFAWGSIGDSRIYHFKDKKIIPLTVDHTLVQQYINSFGKPVPPDVQQKGNILTKAIDGKGDQPDIFPETSEYALLKPSEVFMLCSDGLIMRKDEDLTPVFSTFITEHTSLEQTAKQLIAYAWHDGSKDNITVVMAEYGTIARKKGKRPLFKFPPVENDPAKSPSVDKRRHVVNKTVRIVFILALIALSGLLIWENRALILNKPGLKELPSPVKDNGEKTNLTENQDNTSSIRPHDFYWDKGFSLPGNDLSFGSNESISWYAPVPNALFTYELTFFQKGKRVATKSTTLQTIALKSVNGLRAGKVTVEMNATLKTGDKSITIAKTHKTEFNYLP